MSLEMVLMTPIFIGFLMLLVGVGRIIDAQSQVDGAARDAARSASVARSESDAVTRAADTVAFSLNGHDWCTGGPQAETDTGAWGPGGRVTVTVTCDAELGGLSFIGLPGTKTLTGAATAPIDTYSYRGTEPGVAP